MKREPSVLELADFEPPIKPTVTWGMSSLLLEPLPSAIHNNNEAGEGGRHHSQRRDGSPMQQQKERSKSSRSRGMSRAEEQMVEQMDGKQKNAFSVSPSKKRLNQLSTLTFSRASCRRRRSRRK